MVQFLVILTFVAVHAPGLFGVDWRPRGWGEGAVAAVTLAPLAALWALAQAACVRAGRCMDKTGSISAAYLGERAVTLTRAAGVAHFALCAGTLGWVGVVRGVVGDRVLVDELLAALPPLLLIAAGWWSLYPVERRVREALLWRQLQDGTPVYQPPTRGRFVWGAVRHQMLMVAVPIALISAWQEGVDRYGDAVHLPRSWGVGAEFARAALHLAGMLAVLLLTPAVLRRVWDTTPIGPGEFREMLGALCRRYGVRMRPPLLWRTNGAMVNGAVLGLVWPFRYLLFTDALLDRLTPRQVEAVAAHEVGHIRRRHIFWLGVSVIAALMLSEWAMVLVGAAAGWKEEGGGAETGLGLLSALVIVGVVFGFVSRRFEWQADAFAVRHLSRAAGAGVSADGGTAVVAPTVPTITPEAVEAMVSALRSVAVINGVGPDRFSWRHGSISERVRRLRSLANRPLDRLPIDRQVLGLKVLAALALGAGLGLAVLSAARG